MLVLWGGLEICSLPIAPLIAILARVLLTGAFHEDGLADFFDGMGGGRGRKDVLRIMKDTRIGTYGVLALVLYLLLLYFCVRELTVALGILSLRPLSPCRNPILMATTAMLTADVWGKSLASLLVAELPYARPEEEAKTKVAYARLHWGWHTLRILLALLPVGLLWWHIGLIPPWPVIVAPMVLQLLLALWLRRRLQGYTGDCCGATFLLCELCCYVTWIVCLS